MNRTIQTVKHIRGSVSVPGDKSISHRALMIGAIAEGTTKITNMSSGKDVLSTSNCLKQLGVEIERTAENVIVHGRGLHGLSKPKGILDTGNSGTTMRLLSGILAAQPFESILTGDESLRKRPMNRIVEPLRLMGVNIEASEKGYPPLKIQGGNIKPVEYTTPVASAQIKSCVLLAGLFASGKTTVEEPFQSRDHTERMLECFGVKVEKNELKIGIHGPARLQASSIDVPGDISSSAFFLIAASLISDSDLTLPNVGINPSRTGILDVLEIMGADIQKNNIRIINGEPRADLVIKNSNLKGTIIDRNLIPRIIDEIPILAVASTQAKGKTYVRDAKELRIKETDRITAITKNLRKMGVVIEEKEDGFIISGPQSLKGAQVESFGDHRIAMAFSIAGLVAQGKTNIREAECAEISYPGFFQTIDEVVHE